jgi:hypothetical protein
VDKTSGWKSTILGFGISGNIGLNMDRLPKFFYQSVELLHNHGVLDLSLLNGDDTNCVAKFGGNATGYSGHKHQKGNKIVTLQDNQGNVFAPMTIATVNQSDIVQLPDALKDLKVTFLRCGINIPPKTPLNLDAGFDSRKNHKIVWNAGLKPNIKGNPRNRKKSNEAVNVSLIKSFMPKVSSASELLHGMINLEGLSFSMSTNLKPLFFHTEVNCKVFNMGIEPILKTFFQ